MGVIKQVKPVMLAWLCAELLMVPWVYAQGRLDDKTVLAAADAWPPYVDFQEEEGGYCIEIVRAAFASEGYHLVVKEVPWARAVEAVKSGQYDIIPNLWHTKQREAHFIYSQPYGANTIKFVVNKGDAFEYLGLASLRGKSIGIINGARYGQGFEEATHFETHSVTHMSQNIGKLIKGRIDLTLEDELGLITTLKRHNPVWLQQLRIVDKPFSSNPLHVATGRHEGQGKALIDVFNKGLKNIQKSGQLQAIQQSYFQ
jgi:polar amino acid transport system substrate-binding protein